MNRAANVVIAMWVIASIVGVVTARAQTSSRTVWDGVYTPIQASRGQDIYDKACAECHQSDLSGGGDEAAAVLRGPDFFAKWHDEPLEKLFHAISNMPKTAPGSLTTDAYVDLLCFLLKKNLVPAGDSELTGDTTALQKILITARPQ